MYMFVHQFNFPPLSTGRVLGSPSVECFRAHALASIGIADWHLLAQIRFAEGLLWIVWIRAQSIEPDSPLHALARRWHALLAWGWMHVVGAAQIGLCMKRLLTCGRITRLRAAFNTATHTPPMR